MIYKIIRFPILVLALFEGYGCYSYKMKFGRWELTNLSPKDTTISWAKFEWTSDSISGRYFEKSAINIPAKMKGIPYNLTFQFDLGSKYTMLYENKLKSIYRADSNLENTIKMPFLFNMLQFLREKETIEDGLINISENQVKSKDILVKRNFGDFIPKEYIRSGESVHIGTIGVDIFKNKILIIDYQNTRFAILNEVPEKYQTNFVDIELDKSGMIILPMKIKEKSYRILFDTGSSIFPIITLSKNISKFTSNPDIDTLKISSWGVKHDVIGKMITDTFELAGQRFSNVKVYTNHSGLGISHSTDGMTGNALFWDKTVIIDFKHKKFGVR